MADFDDTAELANVRLRLRSGLHFQLQEFCGEPSYVITDSTSSQYYQIGLTEYAIISLLDGSTSISEAVNETANILGDKALGVHETMTLFRWLVQSGLAEPVDDESIQKSNVARLRTSAAHKAMMANLNHVNPLFARLPLFDPEPLLRRITPKLRWISSRWFLMTWIAVCFTAIMRVAPHSEALLASAYGMTSSSSWVYLLAIAVALKLVHELAHGVVAQHYGVRVSEAGVVFILFIPIPYVDVTSCWGLSSKWHRIAVSAAGMYIEIFIAAVSAIVWSFASDPTIKFNLVQVMIVGSLSTLLFNANFLMRFDGYYILADLLEMPNLYTLSQQHLGYLGKRFLLGMPVQPSQRSLSHRSVFCLYGLATMIWRFVVCATLVIVASTLFYGFGIALAIVAVGLWIGIPAIRLLKQIAAPESYVRPRWSHVMTTTFPVVFVLGAVGFLVPWPFHTNAPAIVRYQDPATVRAQSDGFVKAIYVQDGQGVKHGDVLAALHNPELVTKLVVLQAERDESVIRSRGYLTSGEIAAYQAEAAVRATIESEIADVQGRIDALSIRATKRGVVNAPNLADKQNRYLTRGDVLMEIVDGSQKEILVSIPQRDLEAFRIANATAVNFTCSASSRVFDGRLRQVDPTASLNTDPRLTACAGGPLALKVNGPTDVEEVGEEDVELVEPRFKGWVTLPQSACGQLHAGNTGTIKLNGSTNSIAAHLCRAAIDCITRSYDRAITRR